MKLSSKIQKCELSPIRKFAPFADAARARGIKIYPLNIGQPDIETPAAFFDAVRNFEVLQIIKGMPRWTPTINFHGKGEYRNSV